MTNADFEGANLERLDADQAVALAANFNRAKMGGSRWTKSDLRRVHILDATGEGVSFAEARMGDVDFRGTKLQRCSFVGTDFTNSIFRRVVLKGHTFSNAKFIGADAARCVAEEVSFSRANLSGANFRQANLKRADFTHASAPAADLSGTLLIGAIFREREPLRRGLSVRAWAIGADFSGASLKSADFGNADLSEGDLQENEDLGSDREESKDSELRLPPLFTFVELLRRQAEAEGRGRREGAGPPETDQALATEAEKRPPHATGR